MKKFPIVVLGLLMMAVSACQQDGDRPEAEVVIPEFNFPQTVTFEQRLSAYQLFEGTPADLTPADGFQVLELSSILFTDYAHKQRLIRLPEGTQLERLADGSFAYPNGTILTKTFFYLNDDRDPSLGKRIIETRLLIREGNQWNVATYRWNQDQTDATLEVNGHDTQVNWTNTDGASLSTLYHVPSQNECMTCHQSGGVMSPLGPTLRNLNRMVERNGTPQNQLAYLQSVGLLAAFPIGEAPQMPDYHDRNASLTERGRAYLAMNCAHCHHPDAWEASAERDFDFRYDTPLDQTGIPYGKERILDAVLDGQMPFIGTTVPDQEGIALIMEFIESL